MSSFIDTPTILKCWFMQSLL